MNIVAKKTLTAALAALSVSAALAMSAGSAEARWGRNAAFFGGAAAGLVGAAIIANHAYAAPVYAAPVVSDCWNEKRPVYNRFGDFKGYRYIRVCN